MFSRDDEAGIMAGEIGVCGRDGVFLDFAVEIVDGLVEPCFGVDGRVRDAGEGVGEEESVGGVGRKCS